MLLSNAQLLLSGSEVGVHCLFSGTGFYTPLQVQEQGLLFPGEQESGFEATEVGAGEGVCVCVCVLESHDQDPLCQLKLSAEPSDCHLWSLGIFLDAACHVARGAPKGSLSFKSNESTLEDIIPEPFLIFP